MPPRKDAKPRGCPASDFSAAALRTDGANPVEGPAPYARPAGSAAALSDLTVFETPELAGFEAAAEEAIFILSQSATGRRLMQSAIAADYGVVFIDDPDKNLRGYVDWEQKLVFLAKQSDPRLLALTLGHELAHVSQRVNGAADINVIKDHPLHALKKFLAIEADARTYEIIIALELEYPAAGEDKNRIRFDGIAQMAAGKVDIDVMPKLLASIVPRLADGSLTLDRAMAACFRAFYYDTALRATYENRIMTRIEGLDPAIIAAPESFARLTDSTDFMMRLDGHDIAYLRKHADVTNIDSPQLAAVCARTAARLQQLHAARPANDNAATWTAPIYAPVPAPTTLAARKPKP
ncbi:MAG: hypothetical protein Q8K65_00565 [Alphaproteobacteria bacterium]|nr:hypothetical protein [Alphaproteobacteria bacterium]